MTRLKIRNKLLYFSNTACLSVTSLTTLFYYEGDFCIIPRKSYLNWSRIIKVLASILSLSLLSTLASASSFPAHVGGDIGDDLLCTVCIDIVTDIDSWLTSDTTEDQIVEWMFGLCEVTPLTS